MWLILAMTLLSAGNAVIRKAFDHSSTCRWKQWYMFSAVFLLCAGHALLHNEHIRIDLLSSRYDPRTRAWMELLGTLVFLFPVGLVLWLAPYLLNSLRAGDVSANSRGLILWPG
ncbi:MAG: TRAP transporter small permease subunit [Rivihabitans pingtungensis]